MKRKFISCTICLLGFLSSNGQNQGISNLWQMGYESWAGPPSGGTDIDFFTGIPIISYKNRPLDFGRTNSNISDSSGNLLFYTNGYDICDRTDSIMLNGDSISPSNIRSVDPYGLEVPQACLILPKPGSNNLFYLFHSTLDNAPTYTKAFHLYYSVIDMSLNNGNGSVIQKNVTFINDTLNPGKIIACKHANGRDWWVVCHRCNSNVYYKFLITPYGISTPSTQSIGSIRTVDAGQVVFSSNGEKFAYFNSYYTSTALLDIYNFDRCTGSFSNPTILTIPQSTSFGGGLAFAPNSKYLYVSNIDSVYQFDVSVSNIASSKITVAVFDSFYSPNPPFGTYFDLTQLAPDGKIYIGTGNSTFKMHIINSPDSAGFLCNIMLHAVNIPTWYVGGVPNHPNYFLGPELGSVCDSLPHVGLAEQTSEAIPKVFPNPTDGKFTLWFTVHDKPGIVEVYDINGNLIFKDTVAQWSQYKHLDISKQPAGIYFCKMSWGNSMPGNAKIIKQ